MSFEVKDNSVAFIIRWRVGSSSSPGWKDIPVTMHSTREEAEAKAEILYSKSIEYSAKNRLWPFERDAWRVEQVTLGD